MKGTDPSRVPAAVSRMWSIMGGEKKQAVLDGTYESAFGHPYTGQGLGEGKDYS